MNESTLTQRFDQALEFASRIHRSQRRKTNDVPYVSHLLAVCAIVLENGGNETQAIAGLLHDAPEDQGGMAMLDQIRDEFGQNVAELVEQSSEPLESSELDWLTRKQEFIASLDRVSPDALLIIAADKYHNVLCLSSEIEQCGLRAFEYFNGGREGTLWYYESLASKLSELLPCRLTARLQMQVRALRSNE